MNQHRNAPWIALCAGALVVVGIGHIARMRPEPDRTEVQALLARLEEECDPDSTSNDYLWSSNSPPTERHRREISERLHVLRDVSAAEVRDRLREQRSDEFGEMLVVLAAGLGNRAMITPAARLMAYSEHPAVRLCAARELRKLGDPDTAEWFEYAVSHDDRCVRTDSMELCYPVRTVAELALQELNAADRGTERSSAAARR